MLLCKNELYQLYAYIKIYALFVVLGKIMLPLQRTEDHATNQEKMKANVVKCYIFSITEALGMLSKLAMLNKILSQNHCFT